MSENKVGRPLKHFLVENRSTWEPIVRRMALKRMSLKQIGYRFNAHVATLTGREDVMAIIRECWAEYDEKLMDQMLMLSQANPEMFTEIAERNQVRNIQARAIQYLHTQMLAIVNEELEAPKVAPVTPADIKQKIARLVGFDK